MREKRRRKGRKVEQENVTAEKKKLLNTETGKHKYKMTEKIENNFFYVFLY